MQGAGKFSFGLALAVFAAQASAQTPEYRRVDARLWRVTHEHRWLMDERQATLRLKQSDFATWRANLPVGSALRRLTFQRANRLGWIDVGLPADLDALAILNSLRADPGVQAADLSAVGEYSGVPNDAQFPQQWHLRNTGQSGGTAGDDVGAVSAWDISVGDPSVVIAVIDSGTQVSHPDLSENIWSNAVEIPGNGIDDDHNGFVDDVNGWNFETNSGNVGGTSFHGTATAGMAIARTNNIAGVCGIAGGFTPVDGCRGMILAVGNAAPLTALVDDAIVYAADNGARVITMSFQVPQTAAIDAALQYAHDVRGVCLVSAAGNTNGGAVTYPANQTRVIAVGSSNTSDQRSSFSAVGPEMWVLAPGELIRTTTIGSAYTSTSGTSFSSPLVAGIVGLLFTAMPSLTADDARDLLKRSAKDLGLAGFDPQTGWGRVSASAALTLLLASDCDANGIYDPRQIASGTSPDSNGNGVPDECELMVYCTAKVNSLGCTPSISASGSPSASASSGFMVSASPIRNQRPGLLLYGLSGRAALPFGGGTLCLSGVVRRSAAVNSGGSPNGDDCTGVLSIDMNAFARGLLGGSPHRALSVPGARVGCQWWSSDPVFVFANNPSLSDALEYSIAP